MSEQLNVWCETMLVGKLSIEFGRWHFVYQPVWLASKNSYALSPHLPLQEKSFIDSADNKTVEWFFENLLPEGGIREALARQVSILKNDAYGLLTRYGRETAGALSILLEAEQLETGRYFEFSQQALGDRLTHSLTSPLLLMNDELHMSLAGVQNKLGILYKDNKFYLPQGSAASSHIIKPDNVSENFPYCPANEYFCMRLAKEVGLVVPCVTLLHIPNAIFMIERYDRSLRDGQVQRQHQIDLCQLLNKWVGYKYQSFGGITSKDLFNVVNLLSLPAVAREKTLNWFIFNYIIGNTDAHAKNISYRVEKESIKLAPFYDLLCVQVYLPESTMAMSIAGENKMGWIESKHWENLANEASVPKLLVFSYLNRMSKNILAALDTVLALPEFTADEIQFINTKIIPIIKRQLDYLKF